MIGSTISHYRIVEKLGEGGMGIVYKARDLQLDRFIALKILPADKVADLERKRRFVQEAKSASALNHPNIVVIYEIGSDAAVDFISMEYIRGSTLGQMIGSEGLSVDEAVNYAIQIADALAAAHEAGIVHRDLKPGNIIIGDKHFVKVLDFGLAKLVDSAFGGEFIETQSMTANPPARTEEGLVVGTVAYMSPEQAQAKRVDARSDIFAFGSLLYEMLTGRRPFQRESKVATLAAILHEEPLRLSEIVPTMPAALDRIVTRCLRKEPARRFQHMDEVKVSLEEVRGESGQPAAPVAAARQRRFTRASWTAVMLALACGLVGWSWLVISRSSPPDAAVIPAPVTSEPGFEENASLSPDGNQVAYSWNGPNQNNFDIYVKLIGLPSLLRLTYAPARDTSPAWSPDGRSVAFLRAMSQDRAALITIPALGGPERKLAECYFLDLPFINPAPSWSPAGDWLIIADKGSREDPWALTLVSAVTGEKRPLTTPPTRTIADSDAAFSPDGRSVAFVRTASFLVSDVYLLALTGDLKPDGDAARLTSDNRVTSHPAWMPNGQEIVFSSGNTATLSLWRLAVSGSVPRRRLAYAGDEAITPSISRQGRRLVYTKSIFDPNIWRLTLNGPDRRAGEAASLIASTRIESDPAYSPDGKRIAFESARSGNYEIWASDGDGSNAVQLTSFNGPGVGIPRWSPDGEYLTFDSSAFGQYDIYLISAAGGQPRRLTDHPADDQVPSWSSDGKWVYFASKRTGDFQIWKVSVGGGEALQVTTAGGYAPSESPDGEFLYYTKRGGLWRAPMAGGQEMRMLEAIYGRSYAVVNDGIYFIKLLAALERGPGVMGEIQFLPFSAGAIRRVFAIPKPTFVGFSVAPDGRSILYTQIDQQGTDLMLVENFR